jgi:hypothetical protein
MSTTLYCKAYSCINYHGRTRRMLVRRLRPRVAISAALDALGLTPWAFAGRLSAAAAVGAAGAAVAGPRACPRAIARIVTSRPWCARRPLAASRIANDILIIIIVINHD